MEKGKTSTKVKVDSITLINFLLIVIVLFLHHVNYTQDYLWAISHRLINPYETGIDQVLQKFAVGGFLFFSGYKLTISKQREPTLAFLLNRFLRIYPLYFLAVVLFSVTVYPHIRGEMPSLGNFAVHTLALQAWLPNLYQANYLTIWFVSNLFFCYLAFIFIRRELSDTHRFLRAVTLIVVMINLAKIIALRVYSVDIFSGHFDTYFLFFALGMLSSKILTQGMSNPWQNSLYLPTVSIACAIVLVGVNSFLSHDTIRFYVLERVLIFGFTVPAYWTLLQRLQGCLLSIKGAAFLKNISTASLCVFLFHRPIWTVMYTFMPEKSWLQSLFILGIGIPLIFLMSYYVQHFYSSQVLSRVLKRSQGIQS
ncbi:acyltransferase family protein [Spirulina subsalsa FACHB-351]|uniref:Acyltransferase family protein n=1 Tax=Spirulina subsalsa FACHB-351 TaxID=234711 RepID=A0ABT3L936_9CYAN|nr:acyltransferase family protein [Spirulina subsalsa]MCW6038018.1 acyltransferase family protein [Spirulina subsalsa FACHB-351]